MNATEIHAARVDAVAAAQQRVRLRASLRPGRAFRPTPLLAWRQAADDVAFDRPVKPLLARLRAARSAKEAGAGAFSFANAALSGFEARVVANSLRRAICASVYRCALHTLDLRNCGIDARAARVLGRGLAGNASIQRLTVRNNPLTADGVEYIVRGLVDSYRLLGSRDDFDAWGRRVESRGVGVEGGVESAGKGREDSKDTRDIRESAEARRQAQVSPFIFDVAKRLVTEVGHDPVTPATPHGTIPVRGHTTDGAVPRGIALSTISGAELATHARSDAHTRQVFNAQLDPRFVKEQVMDGPRSGAALALVATVSGTAGPSSFQHIAVTSGLTFEEAVGRPGGHFERHQHIQQKRGLANGKNIDGGVSLAQSSLSTEADPTDASIAQRGNLFNPDAMIGPPDQAPLRFNAGGISPRPFSNHCQTRGSGGSEVEEFESVTSQSKSFPSAMPHGEVHCQRAAAPISISNQPSAAILHNSVPLRLRHPLQYLNLSSTLLAIGGKQSAAALDIKSISSSDSRGCDALGDFLHDPRCALENLNISKNRLEPRCCEKLWVCLDRNASLEVLDMHNTLAGPVAASGFAAKALGLSLSHGRAALADSRLGGFVSPRSPAILQVAGIGDEGSRFGAGAALRDLKGELPGFGREARESAFRDRSALDRKEPDQVAVDELESLYVETRSVFEPFKSLAEASPTENNSRVLFRERTRGISKLNLSTCGLGDVGALALSVLMMAARRSDEVLQGRLKQRTRLAKSASQIGSANTSAAGGAFLVYSGADKDAEARSINFSKHARLSSLQWLKLGSNGIGPLAVRSLCRSLRLTQSLVTLDLTHNPIGVEGAHSLAEALAHPHCALRELVLDSCQLGELCDTTLFCSAYPCICLTFAFLYTSPTTRQLCYQSTTTPPLT